MKDLFLASLLLLTASCTNIYFEQPVPQSGAPLDLAPTVLQGAYEVIKLDAKCDDGDPMAPWLKHCYYFDQLEGERLLVSEEARFLEQDLEHIKAVFAQKKATGELSDYAIGKRGICYTTAADSTGKSVQAYIPIVKQGAWYILTGTQTPQRLFDFRQKTSTEMESHRGRHTDEILPGADSMEVKTAVMLARTQSGAYYLNTRLEGAPGWLLLYLAPTGNDEWLLKYSTLPGISDSVLDNHRTYYEAITPFRKASDSESYLISPDDHALQALLADKNLFFSLRLRKMGE